MAGTLFVVATPLGNLEDISERALRVLREVALIACEDTRRTARLLSAYGIATPTVSCHRFNERARLAAMIERLTAGDDVALVSDGGTPVVSDPGTLLVSEAAAAGLRVTPIPGPSAVAALISVSGETGDRFVFDGFLPHREGERRRRLRELRDETRSVVLFESPHRIRQTLTDIDRVLGDRPLVLGRELTKLHESIERGTAAEIAERLPEPVRGEIALLLGAVSATRGSAAPDDDRVLETWRRVLDDSSGDRRQALKQAARELGVKKAELQRLLMELGEAGT